MTTTAATPHIEKVIELLGRVRLFHGLPRSDLERIAALLRGRTAEPGELLFREGDPGDRFYVVFSGSVEVVKERPRGAHERLAVKRAGEAFGEMSLLTDAPRSASVRALERTQLLVAARDEFDALLGGDSFTVRLMRALATALRALDVRFAAREADGGAEALRRFSRLVRSGLQPRQVPAVEGYDVGAGAVQDEAGAGNALWAAYGLAGGGALLAVLDVKGSGLPPGYLLGVATAVLRPIAAADGDMAGRLSRLNEVFGASLFEGLDECVEADDVGSA